MSNIELDYKTIYKKLREDESERRLDKGLPMLSIDGLIKEFHKISSIKFSRGTISEIENGKRPPSYELLKCYHEYFKIPYDTLMGRVVLPKNQSMSW